MYTAEQARIDTNHRNLDRRIEDAVRNYGPHSAYLRIYRDDSFFKTVKQELQARGFINIQVPDISDKGDVYFEW